MTDPHVCGTPAAVQALRDLAAAQGPLMLFVSGGCCDGSAPLCLRAGELVTGSGDLLLGEVGGAEVWIDAEQYERWNRPEFELDVSPGAAGGFSLEGLAGIHFVLGAARVRPARTGTVKAVGSGCGDRNGEGGGR